MALRRLEDGIPNQALREIKALQEIEDSQYVSGAGIWWTRRWATGSKTAASRPLSLFSILTFPSTDTLKDSLLILTALLPA